MWNLKKMIQMNLFTVRWKGEDKLGVWDYQIHTSIYKIDNQQGPIV